MKQQADRFPDNQSSRSEQLECRTRPTAHGLCQAPGSTEFSRVSYDTKRLSSAALAEAGFERDHIITHRGDRANRAWTKRSRSSLSSGG
ncbi:hypothetical protein C0214_17045 [Methylobacterium sp. DM1]|nr:hypothetical protein C0214_17045 [Methylobacterium sp. DM1]